MKPVSGQICPSFYFWCLLFGYTDAHIHLLTCILYLGVFNCGFLLVSHLFLTFHWRLFQGLFCASLFLFGFYILYEIFNELLVRARIFIILILYYFVLLCICCEKSRQAVLWYPVHAVYTNNILFISSQIHAGQYSHFCWVYL